MNVNAKYKNSVFTHLFSDPDLLRDLYCALEGVSLPADTSVVINTLEDVLFMDLINDISFVIGGKLVVLIEHQSTVSPNLPLRLLLYIARVYEKMFKGDSVYTSKLIPIPRPAFFVLYNGIEAYPDEKVLKLSDAFEQLGTLGLIDKTLLELEVRVLNINEGRNAETVRRCRKLAEYSAFIAKVRHFEQELGSREEGIKAAIKHCMEHDILKEFLEEHSSEVFNMLLTEWNTAEAIAVSRREGEEIGLEKGEEIGLEKGLEIKALEIARKALAKGWAIEEIQDITGLDLETIENLRK